MTLGRILFAAVLVLLAACSVDAVSDSPTGGAAGGGTVPDPGSGGQSSAGSASGGNPGSGGGISGTGGLTGRGGANAGGASTSGTGGHNGTGGASVAPGNGGNLPGTGGSVGGAPGHGGNAIPKDGGIPGTGGAAGGADAGSATVSYSKDVQPLLNSNCTSCHGASSASAGVDLSSYAKVKSNASRANAAIQAGRMPPAGPLSTANKQLFQTWVTEGTPNN